MLGRDSTLQQAKTARLYGGAWSELDASFPPPNKFMTLWPILNYLMSVPCEPITCQRQSFLT